MANQYNNEFESAEIKSQCRPGFGEFANVPRGIHLQEPTDKQMSERKKNTISEKIAQRKMAEMKAAAKEAAEMEEEKRERERRARGGSSEMDVWKKHIEGRLSILEKGIITEKKGPQQQETPKQVDNKEAKLAEINKELDMAMASEDYGRAEILNSEIDSLNASKAKNEIGDIVNNLLELIHFVEYKSPTMKNWIVVKVKQIYLHDNSVDIEIDGGNIRNTVFKYLRKADITFNKYKINQPKSWIDLKVGMTKEQVKLILGDPIRVKVDYYGEKWCYIDRDFLERDRYNPNNQAKPGEVVFCDPTLERSSLFDPSRKEEPKKLKYWEEP